VKSNVKVPSRLSSAMMFIARYIIWLAILISIFVFLLASSVDLNAFRYAGF